MRPTDAEPPIPPRKYLCDLCGDRIQHPETGRFIVTIDVRSDPHAATVSEEDLKRDLRAEMRRLIEQMEQMSLDEIEDSVHRAFRFDLCAACKKQFLDDPLGKTRRV